MFFQIEQNWLMEDLGRPTTPFNAGHFLSYAGHVWRENSIKSEITPDAAGKNTKLYGVTAGLSDDLILLSFS